MDNTSAADKDSVVNFYVAPKQYVVSQNHVIGDPSVMPEVRPYHEQIKLPPSCKLKSIQKLPTRQRERRQFLLPVDAIETDELKAGAQDSADCLESATTCQGAL
jgi:hypothetical protein